MGDINNEGDVEVKFGNMFEGESYAAVTITTSATQIIAANTLRRYVIITNNGNQTVFIGFDNSVTTSNGMPIIKKAGIIIDQTEVNIYGIAASGTIDIRYMEV